MKRRYAIAGLVGLAGCRFGGPSGDPGAYVTFPEDGGVDATSPADDGGSTGPRDDAPTAPPDDDATGDDGPGDDGPGGDASTGDATASETDDGHACSGTVAVCDPVHNTGCNGLQQCDVDPSQTTTPTGLCLFASPAEGGPCTSTLFTESCAARSTCVGGACRELCFCDADCPTGQCCSDTSGPPGFALCAPCP
jgi:hypothetical protein